MPESYFEKARITVDAELKSKKFFRTKPYSGPVTITVSKVNPPKTLQTINVTAKDGKFDRPVTFEAPAVDKTEEFYQLRVACSYKQINKLLLEASIWPRTSNARLVDEKGKNLADVDLTVTQGSDSLELTSGPDGTCVVPLFARAPYSLVVTGRYFVLEEKQATAGQFRNHFFKVKKAIKARIDSPKTDADPYKADPDDSEAKIQYVNVVSANPDHRETGGCDARGPNLVVSITADPPDSGKKDDKVFFSVTFGKESKRNAPATGIDTAIPVLDKKVQDKTTTGYVLLAADGGKASFEINLGIAGGDTCTVKVGGTPAVEDAKFKLVNWRKMYAQATKTASITPPSLADAVDCLKKVHIDLEDSVADAVDVDASQAPPGSVVDGNAIVKSGMPATSLIVGDHNVAWFQAKLQARFASEKLPCAHLIYCHEQLDANNAPIDSTTTILGRKAGQTQGTVAFPGGGSVPGVAIPGTVAGRNGLFFSKDLRDGSDAVKSCSWQEVGGPGSGTIDPADYAIDSPNQGNTLYIRLPQAAKDLSDAGKTIRIAYKVAYSKGWYNGWTTSSGRHIVIKVGRADKDICGTIVHEIGHAINQAAKSPDGFPGLPAPPHERYYTNNRGHQGPHCADGIDAATYNDATQRMDTSHASSKCTCIMYGAGSSLRNQNLAFCSKCEPYVKAAQITTVST